MSSIYLYDFLAVKLFYNETPPQKKNKTNILPNVSIKSYEMLLLQSLAVSAVCRNLQLFENDLMIILCLKCYKSDIVIDGKNIFPKMFKNICLILYFE